MKSSFDKAETIIGMSLLVLAVLGFILSVTLALPRNDAAVNAIAKPIPTISDNFFTDANPITKQLNALTKPPGIPVTVDPSNLSRPNAFQKY